MYAGALVMLLATPLALGSWWGLAMFIPMVFVIVLRLLDEEKFLQKGLPGYAEYCLRVRFRLAPFIW
jgi:protein-S-isoprenylcysteine O-methyltransferase Ste14